MGTTLELLQHIPADYLVVSESGLQDYATIARLAAHGVAAFLIGESLMREADMGQNSPNSVGPSSLSERKSDALFMAGFFPKTANHTLNSTNFGAKMGVTY